MFRRDLRATHGRCRQRLAACGRTARFCGRRWSSRRWSSAGFLAGYDTALVAAAGAAALLVTRRVRPRKVYAAIDWDLLMLFIGLFVIVGAGERAGFDQRVFGWLAPLGITTLTGLSATTALISNAISNVPAVMLFTKIVPRLPDPLDVMAGACDVEHAGRQPHHTRIRSRT